MIALECPVPISQLALRRLGESLQDLRRNHGPDPVEEGNHAVRVGPRLIADRGQFCQPVLQWGLSRSRPCGGPASGVAVAMTPPDYAGYRFPPDVIQRAVWMYLRFILSYRDVGDLLAERGIEVSYEAVRRWVRAFGPMIARRLRAQRPAPHRQWHLDEMFIRISGKPMYLWRAVDAEGEVLEVLIQPRRDAAAARKLMRKLLKKQGIAPNQWVTDKCPAYGAGLRDLRLDGIPHLRGKRLNNRSSRWHRRSGQVLTHPALPLMGSDPGRGGESPGSDRPVSAD